MNITELIERLEELAEAHPDAEVLLAHQPSWPLQFKLGGVACTTDFADAADVPEGPCPDHDREDCVLCLEDYAEPVRVYLVEGGHPDDTPYAPSAAWEVAS